MIRRKDALSQRNVCIVATLGVIYVIVIARELAADTQSWMQLTLIALAIYLAAEYQPSPSSRPLKVIGQVGLSLAGLLSVANLLFDESWRAPVLCVAILGSMCITIAANWRAAAA